MQIICLLSALSPHQELLVFNLENFNWIAGITNIDKHPCVQNK